MWDDLWRMEGSWSTGWQYHLCILHGWTIQDYIAHQRDWVRGCDAIDTNGSVMMDMWNRLKITSGSSDQTSSPMFWSSSCRAQLRITPTHTHLEAAQNNLCQHSWVLPFLLPQGACVRRPPPSGALWQKQSLPRPQATTSWVLRTGRKCFRGRKR